MIFNVPGHIAMIQNGLFHEKNRIRYPDMIVKTQTRRLNRGIYQVGRNYAIQRKRGVKAEPDIRIVMDRIWEELPLKWKEYIESGDVVPELGIKYFPISEEDAQAEGGYSVEEYEKVFRQINPKWAEDVRYAFKFHVIEVQT